MNALSIGLASLLNTRLVMRFGMRLLVRSALWTSIILSMGMLVIAFFSDGQPSLVVLMVYTMTTLFCVGILFGNNNALAMEPLGKVAGIGAAIVGSLSTFISVPLGTLVGQSFNGTVIPLVAGFGILAVFSLVVFHWIESDSE
jgi:DHA1 family bicyclomycin/chloramphenicol resistance-like MFS transporter